jgi:hypothetical protein
MGEQDVMDGVTETPRSTVSIRVGADVVEVADTDLHALAERRALDLLRERPVFRHGPEVESAERREALPGQDWIESVVPSGPRVGRTWFRSSAGKGRAQGRRLGTNVRRLVVVPSPSPPTTL